ncbi:hypothetical protein A2U01_0031110, partial [Trifolium medium]|nr:hypothetical protein [Trifolium medium]
MLIGADIQFLGTTYAGLKIKADWVQVLKSKYKCGDETVPNVVPDQLREYVSTEYLNQIIGCSSANSLLGEDLPSWPTSSN